MVPHLLLFLLLISTSSLSGIESAAATLKLTNRCRQPIWPEILPGASSPLPSGKSRTIPIPKGWSGRIWGRTLCETSAADCGSAGKAELSLDGANAPATSVELALDGAGGLEYSYGVSSVDGSDVPVAVLPNKVGPTRGGCGRAVGPNPTAAREEGDVACNDTGSIATTHTDHVVVFCPKPYSSGEVVGRRRGRRVPLSLVNKTTTTTAWPSRHPNGAALSSAADINLDFTEAATTSSPADHQESNGRGDEMMTPKMVMEPVKVVEMRMMLNDQRRRLNSFQMCALCTCCGGGSGGSKHYCLLSPCCYAINCNIPNKPFGFCSFTPRACNCFGCHV
ncbi:unnamed protein product [Linum tenue]|uniref:DUF7866 domain-containing protein n=1 Tax=Linum tenue TaxID=586396 RepID=A0AAV0GU92_9ROSI|nr:unnamed protein product [Linum tenue]